MQRINRTVTLAHRIAGEMAGNYFTLMASDWKRKMSQDCLEHAMETDGVESGLFAEFSQRLKDLRDELDQRLARAARNEGSQHQ